LATEGNRIFLFSRKALFRVHRHACYFNSVSTEQTESYESVLAVMRQQRELTEDRIRREIGLRVEELLDLISNKNSTSTLMLMKTTLN
jgi:hypothetical protein